MNDAAVSDFVIWITDEAFVAPRGMNEKQQAERIRLLRDAVLSAVPRGLSFEMLRDVLDGAKRTLANSAKTAAWPLPAEVRDAVKRHAPDREASNLAPVSTDLAVEWFRKFGDVPSWWNNETMVRAMVRSGVAPHDLWRGGADVPRDLRDWPGAHVFGGSPAAKRFGGGEQ